MKYQLSFKNTLQVIQACWVGDTAIDDYVFLIRAFTLHNPVLTFIYIQVDLLKNFLLTQPVRVHSLVFPIIVRTVLWSSKNARDTFICLKNGGIKIVYSNTHIHFYIVKTLE